MLYTQKMALTLNYTTTHHNATKPKRDNKNCVGYSLFATENIIFQPLELKKIDIGIILEMQGSYYGQIEDILENFKVLGGVIDPGYRGSIIVALLNKTNQNQTIFMHDVLAQMIFLPVILPELVYKDYEEEISTEEKEEKLKTYVKYTKTHPSAITPTRFEEGSVGYDLHALKNAYVPPFKTVKVDTGIELEIQGPFYAQIRDKSGFSTKRLLHVFNGVVDSSHKSSIVVYFENVSNQEQHIFAKEKIAQIIFLPVLTPIMQYKDEIDKNTTRGERGFQSGEIKSIC